MASRQFLIFKLFGEDFGVDIANIDSIISMKEIIKVPNTPEYIEGLTNLRGKVYTIFNLRKRLNLPNCEYDDSTKIVIVNVNSIMVGFIVDEVNEISRIEDENLESTPPALANLDKKFISGIAKFGERIIITLDLNTILSLTENTAIKAIV